MYAWDEIKLAEVKQNLKQGLHRNGRVLEPTMSDDEVEAKFYYDRKYFTDRVPRIVKPSCLA